MPSLRVISVAVLVGMGAVVAAVSGANGRDHANVGASSLVRGTQIVASGSASPSPSPSSSAGFDVAAENARPGTPGWRISRAAGTRAGLDAYTDVVSVQAGQPVPLLVSALGVVQVKAFRIGWYGGVGARQVWQGSLRARPEPGPPSQWQARGWAVTTNWPQGHYLLRLDLIGTGAAGAAGAAATQVSRYLPLTVRSADARGRIVVLTSPITWQVENSAPGKQTASFNRPYAAGYGSGGFLAADQGLVQAAERSGKKLAYATDYDVAADPALISKASAVLVGGDSRYWTTSLRATVQKAGDAGTNLAFFGAGTGSRQVSLTGKGRTLKIAGTAPSDSVKLTGVRPSCLAPTSTPTSTPSSTSTPTSTPTPDPSSTGSSSQTSPTDKPADWTVSNAAWWGYRGTGVKTGTILPGLLADGTDRAVTSSPDSLSPTQVLGFTKITCGTTVDGSTDDVQSAVYQVRGSKAGVFTAGTGRWVCVLANACVDPSGAKVAVDQPSRRFALQVTANVISAFAKSRAGERFPARDSASQYALLR